jgi:diaminohydroxyphosphoribosylaminopyrimidine deaminase/5-amino-6-(5-phosphoribosylamino)uracil reductase
MLRDGAVKVEFAAGEEATAARQLNQPFRKHARTGLPLVTLKLAMSLDGQTETAPGDSPWISNERSQQLVHRWRAESDAVAVGIGTVLADDPLLTARPARLSFGSHSGSNLNHGVVRQPLRVVFDRQARLPLDSQLVRTLDQSPVLVIASQEADPARLDGLRDAGAETLIADGIDATLSELGRRNITSLFLEGGRTLAAAFLATDAIDESRTFVAPVLLGAPRAGGGVGGTSPEEALATAGGGGSPAPTGPARQPALSHAVEQIGDDTLITARFKEW